MAVPSLAKMVRLAYFWYDGQNGLSIFPPMDRYSTPPTCVRSTSSRSRFGCDTSRQGPGRLGAVSEELPRFDTCAALFLPLRGGAVTSSVDIVTTSD